MKRPKTVYKANIDLARDWATGRLSPRADYFYGNNMRATHRRIYSYGEHFCIAEKRDGLVLFTERTYSNTTSKHKNCVANSLRGDSTLDVSSLDHNLTPTDWQLNKFHRATEFFNKAQRARSLRIYHIHSSVELLNDAVKISLHLGAPVPTPAALPPGYLDFLAVEAFKAKCDGIEFPTLHSVYTTIPTAVAA